MTNSRTNKGMKRKRNPLASNTITRAPRMKVKFDGQIFKGSTHVPAIVTAGNVFSTIHAVSSQNINLAVANTFAGMFNFYKEYKFMSLTLEWIPAVAPGVADGGSEILISFNWNPEQLVSQFAAAPATVINNLRSDRTSRSFNAWERFTYNVPLHSRRKMFDCDVNPTGAYLTDTNQIDRAVHGGIVVGATSISAIATLGHFRCHYSVRLEGVGLVST